MLNLVGKKVMRFYHMNIVRYYRFILMITSKPFFMLFENYSFVISFEKLYYYIRFIVSSRMRSSWQSKISQ